MSRNVFETLGAVRLINNLMRDEFVGARTRVMCIANVWFRPGGEKPRK